MTAVRWVGTRSEGTRPAALRLVGPLTGRDLGWRTTVVVCVVGTLVALVVSVAIQGQRISLQEEADRIAVRTARAQDDNRALRIAVVEAESPGQVLDAAHRAGMIEPGPIAVIPAAADPATTTTTALVSRPTSSADSVELGHGRSTTVATEHG